MAIGQQDFRAALRHWASGVTVITTKDRAGQLHGLTVSAFSSVSLAPPLVLVCIEKTTFSHHALIENGNFVVNILSDGQQHLSQHFASKLPDKFAGVEFDLSENGVPLLRGALANLECRLAHSYEGGDHSIFVGEIENAVIGTGKPLLYYDGSYRQLA